MGTNDKGLCESSIMRRIRQQLECNCNGQDKANSTKGTYSPLLWSKLPSNHFVVMDCSNRGANGHYDVSPLTNLLESDQEILT